MTKEEKLTVLNALISSAEEAKKHTVDSITALTKEIAFQQRLIERSRAFLDFSNNQLSGLVSDIDAVNQGKL